ncbi:hypothetical protein [Anditalea andensis]|uniref:Uncharacterized protein n=1 Tax=Anditalea andensis TaxID=1048983 RepID=A0A074KY04_9BACT|nr:hypothetical protein [Anditalea andensis]KEO72483.1 hypothetical protein EL17_17245 [Anditalea andensis]
MRNLLIRAFVAPYYKAFLGFFILIFIAFGLLMEVRQHIIIGTRILEHPLAFLTLLFMFLIYGWVQFRFHIHLIKHGAYQVFHQMALFKSSDFSSYQLVIWVYNHLLLIIYVIFLSFLSVKIGYWFQPVLLWVTLSGMASAHRIFLYYALARPLPDHGSNLLKKFTRKSYSISSVYWLIMHLKENRLWLLLACKLMVLILLKMFYYSYSTGAYDARWIHFSVLCAAFINLPIWLEKKEFERSPLKIFLNLPRPIFIKAGVHLVSTLLIIAPEIMYVIFQYPYLSNIQQLLSILLLSLSLNLGIIALINFTKEASHLSRNVTIKFFTLFLLIIFGFPVIFVSLMAIVIFIFSIRSPYVY